MYIKYCYKIVRTTACSFLLICFAHFVLAVPVKFSASVYHVCTVKGSPTSVEITLEAMKDRKFDFTVKVHIRDGTAKSM